MKTLRPTPIDRARIRVATGCDDATIRAYFSPSPDRKLQPASEYRITGACARLGIPLPASRDADVAGPDLTMPPTAA